MNQTRSYARYRLLSSLGGKLADALGVIIAIKTLAPADYGVIGTALGVLAVLGFANLTPEDILWRDQPKLGDRLTEYLAACVWFWLVKLGAMVVLAAGFCLVYGKAHQSWAVAAAAWGIVCALQLLTSSTLVEVPLFAGLRQQRGAAFVLGVRVLWLLLLVPNFWLRSLAYYLVALALYAAATTAISFVLLRRQLGVRQWLAAGPAWRLVRRAALDFTVWLHLVSRARLFLMRGDLAILGGLGVTLAALGGYTVAVNLAGFALLVPGVLENVATISFARAPERRAATMRKFLAAAAALALVQVGGGWLVGRTALRLLHVANVAAVFGLFMTLLAGMAVLTLGSPALAYAMCFRRMRGLFAWVWLPAVAAYAVAVWWAGRAWGLAGVATAHAVVSGATGLAMLGYVWFSRDEVVGEVSAGGPPVTVAAAAAPPP